MVYWEGWPKEKWTQALAQLLTREAQPAYFSLSASALDYLLMKEQILGCCGFSVCHAVTEFHCWVYQAEINPFSQMDALLRTTK